MIDIENVSSPFAVPGSDVDYNVYVGPGDWAALTEVFEDEGFGELVRPGVWRVEPAQDVEVFICTSGVPYDDLSRVVCRNVAAMKMWPQEIAFRYENEKMRISHLRGWERKRAKAELAVRFGLDPSPYMKGG